MGALLSMPLSDRVSLRKSLNFILFYFTRLRVKLNGISSDARGRTSLPDCSVSCPISRISPFRFLLLVELEEYFKLVLNIYISVKNLQPIIISSRHGRGDYKGKYFTLYSIIPTNLYDRVHRRGTVNG